MLHIYGYMMVMNKYSSDKVSNELRVIKYWICYKVSASTNK